MLPLLPPTTTVPPAVPLPFSESAGSHAFVVGVVVFLLVLLVLAVIKR